MTTMLASDLPLPRIGRGKVRDVYAVGDDRVLLLTTDRISAFDVVMAETIPAKGAVLTQISAWWFRRLECVVRGYISGSAWKEYAVQGTLAGEKLAVGLTESAKLEPAIFSPASKAETGHDENISVARVREIVGDAVAHELESMARTVYALGENVARAQGIVIADTKFEFGRDKYGRIILIDEVM